MSGTLTPEVLPPGRPISFAGAPEWLTAELRTEIEQVARLHAKCFGQFHGGAVASVICGMKLLALKRLAGHGKWGSVRGLWLEQVGLCERTAQRYMALANVARKALVAAGASPLLLGDGQQIEQDRMATVLGERLNPEDWRELLEAFKLVKPCSRGGFHPPREWLEKFAKLKKLASAEYEDWDAATRAAFRKWLKEEKRRANLAAAEADPAFYEERRRVSAVRQWTPVLSAVKIGLQGKATWTALPRETKADLRDNLKRFADMIEATL